MKTSLGEPERRSATIDKLDHDSHSVTVRFGSFAVCGGVPDLEPGHLLFWLKRQGSAIFYVLNFPREGEFLLGNMLS